MTSSTGGNHLRLTETSDGIVVYLHVQPRASRNEICGIQGDELKVRLTSPPVDDAANKLCVEFLAKLLKVPKSDVSLISGHKSRHKAIHVAGATRREILSLLDK